MMKPKHIVMSLSIAVSIAIMAMMPDKSSSGGPASHTGAPGEETCASIGCHDDNSVNSGQAKLTIDMGTVSNYEPGHTYPITVKITESSVTRFGFQILALKNDDNSNIGTFQLTDPKRTQFIKNQYTLQNREYVTYTFNGTDAVSPGVGEWTINWKAPSTNVGPITFYASGVSANDDENDKGDYVYTTHSVIQPSHKLIETQKQSY
jgi:Reeler domain